VGSSLGMKVGHDPLERQDGVAAVAQGIRLGQAANDQALALGGIPA